MKLYLTETKQVERITAWICDKCQERYDDPFEMQEFHHIDFVGGYGSVFGDGNQVLCDLCQDCLKELLGPFLRIAYTYKEFLQDND